MWPLGSDCDRARDQNHVCEGCDGQSFDQKVGTGTGLPPRSHPKQVPLKSISKSLQLHAIDKDTPVAAGGSLSLACSSVGPR
jgi:hypothetical protein